MKGNLRLNNMEEFNALQNRNKLGVQKDTPKTVKLPVPGKEHGKMNKLEASYAQHLEARKHLKEIVRWKFDPFGLKLADKTYYHPDFMVVFETHIEIHETKGFMRDDANVKLKVAASQFPEFKFVLVKKLKGQWDFKEISTGFDLPF